MNRPRPRPRPRNRKKYNGVEYEDEDEDELVNELNPYPATRNLNPEPRTLNSIAQFFDSFIFSAFRIPNSELVSLNL